MPQLDNWLSTNVLCQMSPLPLMTATLSQDKGERQGSVCMAWSPAADGDRPHLLSCDRDLPSSSAHTILGFPSWDPQTFPNCPSSQFQRLPNHSKDPTSLIAVLCISQLSRPQDPVPDTYHGKDGDLMWLRGSNPLPASSVAESMVEQSCLAQGS